MRRAAWTLMVACGSLVLAGCRTAPADGLYPPIEPSRSGYLRVSDLHELYWEVVGNPEGIPVVVLHGGPGGSAWPEMRRYFDPSRFQVLLFDQRGALRSRPTGEWRENTTTDLIEDIDRLLDHVGIRRKPILFGGSWGATLALAYAERHPERVAGMVLRGVFLCTNEEIDYLYHGGASMFFPDAWDRLKLIVPSPEVPDYPRQLFEMITGDDPRERETAIEGWTYYETRLSSVYLTDDRTQRVLREREDARTPLALLENYYMMNGCFLGEGELLEHADRIANLPIYIVQGRDDMVTPPVRAYLLAQRLDVVELELTDAAGHSAGDAPNRQALLRGVEWVAERADAGELPEALPPPER